MRVPHCGLSNLRIGRVDQHANVRGRLHATAAPPSAAMNSRRRTSSIGRPIAVAGAGNAQTIAAGASEVLGADLNRSESVEPTDPIDRSHFNTLNYLTYFLLPSAIPGLLNRLHIVALWKTYSSGRFYRWPFASFRGDAAIRSG
jgi:hypothetical protein